MKKTASISALIVAFSAVAGLAALSTACSDDDTNGSSSGSTSGSTSGNSSGNTSSGSTSGSTSGNSSGGTPTLDAQYKAICDAQKKCGPNTFAANFPTDADCIAYYKAVGGDDTALPGEPTITQAQIDACTAKYTSRACGDFTVPAECEFKGTLPNDAACNEAGQCMGGDCKKAAATDNCGKCADAPAPETPKAKGDACNPGEDMCAAGLTCQGASGATKCDTAKQLNETCTGGATLGECAFGLLCTDGKCAELPVGKAGDDCSPSKLCGFITLSCVNSKCVAKAKEGEDCAATPADTTKPDCGAGLTCTSGKCAKPAATEVCK